MKIIGNTFGMGLPKPNLMQADPKKGDYVHGKEEFLSEAGGGVTSWNDLKDKPFGDEGGSGEVEIFSQTVEGFALGTDGVYGASMTAPFTLAEGDTYRVSWDGMEYTYVGTDMDGVIGVGNLEGDPLGLAIVPGVNIGLDFDLLAIITVSDKPSHDITIYHVTGGVKTLDAKYLPMDAIDARIDAYMEKALGGDY